MQWSEKLAVAGAVLMLLAAGCTASAASGGPPAHSGFAGYTWQVTAISHGGKRVAVPADADVLLEFGTGGQFLANEPVNSHSGTYRQAGDGFITSELASSAVGYVGGNPVKLLAISAISAFDGGVQARADVSGDQMTVVVAGYRLSCQRDGRPTIF